MLTPNEEARYKKIFKIFKSVVDPDPEAGKVDSTVQKKPTITPLASKIKQKSPKLDNKRLGIMAGVGGIIAAIMAVLPKMFTEIGTGIYKAITGLISASKLWDVLSNSFVGKGLLKLMNGLGKGLGKVFDIVSDFKNSKFLKSVKGFGSSIKNIFNGFGKVFGTLLKPMAGIGSKIFSGGKMFLKMFAPLGKIVGRAVRFVPVVGSLFNFATAIEAAGNGEYGRSILEVIAGIANIVPGGQLISGMINGATLLYDLMSENETGAGLRDIVGKGGSFIADMFGGLWKSIKGVFSGVGDFIGGIFESIGGFIKGAYNKVLGFFADLFRGKSTFGFEWGDLIAGGIDNIAAFYDGAVDMATGAVSSLVGGGGDDSSSSDSESKIENSKSTIDEMNRRTQDYRMRHIEIIASTNAKMDTVIALLSNKGGSGIQSSPDKLQSQYYAG